MTDVAAVFPDLPLVEYAEVRAQIRSGDLLLANGNYTFSKLIQRATNSVWSHVAFVLRLDELDRIMVLESIEQRGVRAIPLSQYVLNFENSGQGYNGRIAIARHAGFAAAATPEALKCLAQSAIDRLSYPYSDEDIARITLRIVAGSLHMQPGEIERGDEDICSEFVERIYKPIGLKIPHDSRGFCAPSDFGRCPEVSMLWELTVTKPATIIEVENERNTS